jgi:hypothetical protein
MMAWQTIDTAPMDGTLVLVAATRRPRVIPVGARYIEGEGWLTVPSDGKVHTDLTHWHPMPDPPSRPTEPRR